MFNYSKMIRERRLSPVPQTYEEIKRKYIRPDPPRNEMIECIKLLWTGTDGAPGIAHCCCGCATVACIGFLLFL